MTRGLSLMLVAVLAALTQAQSTAELRKVITGIDCLETIGGKVFVTADSVPVVQTVLYVDLGPIPDNPQILRFDVTDSTRAVIAENRVERLSNREWCISGTGKIWIDAWVIDLPTSTAICERLGPYVIPPGTVPDEPDKPDVPDNPAIPDDAFDNIGKRVASWSTGLSANQSVGSIYRKWASELRTTPSQTINTAAAGMSAELKAVPNYATYASMTTQINADLAKRWPMSKGVLADYWTAIALGLGVK